MGYHEYGIPLGGVGVGYITQPLRNLIVLLLGHVDLFWVIEA